MPSFFELKEKVLQMINNIGYSGYEEKSHFDRFSHIRQYPRSLISYAHSPARSLSAH